VRSLDLALENLNLVAHGQHISLQLGGDHRSDDD
jgi:hypothetical protein